MTAPVDVVVPVPAHDEQDRIEGCLTSVQVAVTSALAEGLLRRATIAVAAHRCTDATAARSRSVLARQPDSDGGVHVDLVSSTVGEARSRLIRAVTKWWPEPDHNAWIFSTDADSTVPADWITTVLRHVAADGPASAVAGLVDLVDWEADESAREEYRQIVAAGMRADGHDHVYAANLAVRLQAYRHVGGFPSVAHGEDHALLRRLRLGGWPVLTVATPVVRTSGRMPGRATQGLGALLQDLTETARPCPEAASDAC